MKVLFLFSLHNISSFEKPLLASDQFNFGISYISSLLKEHGHETSLVVLGSEEKAWRIRKQLEEIINDFQPDIIGFSSISTQYPFVSSIASEVKEKYKGTFLVIGGAHATLCPDEVIEGPFDAICIGEGEYPMLELVECLENNKKPSTILNLWIKTDKGIIRNSNRPFILDLDSLPFPDRDIWVKWTEENIDGRLSILLGRGCPFECTYCSNNKLKTNASGKYVRFRSPQNIVSEIRYLRERFPEKHEYFLEVESFNVNRKWVVEFTAALADYCNNIDKEISFGTNIRITPNTDFDEMFALCTKANINTFTAGLESGSERIRSEVMNRRYSNADVIRMAEQAKKHRCKFGFQNMIGLPTETEDEFMETVKLNKICQPDWYFLSIFFPYPETDLWYTCKNMGLLHNNIDTRIERSQPALTLPTFPRGRIRKRRYMFEYDVYRSKKPFYKILIRTLITMMTSHPLSYRSYFKLKRFRIFRLLKSVT